MPEEIYELLLRAAEHTYAALLRIGVLVIDQGPSTGGESSIPSQEYWR